MGEEVREGTTADVSDHCYGAVSLQVRNNERWDVGGVEDKTDVFLALGRRLKFPWVAEEAMFEGHVQEKGECTVTLGFRGGVN